MNLLPPASNRTRRQLQQEGYAIMSGALPLALVKRWRQKAEQLKTNALTIKRTDGEFSLVYRVVTGETIRNQWPELFEFYADPRVLQWIKAITGKNRIDTSPSLRSAVNLNIMESKDSVYRWHFDAVPYTMLLYLNDIVPEDGGAIQMIPGCEPHKQPNVAESRIIELWPTAGTVVLMDGTRCYHRVSQLLRPTTRFSIPLVYPNAAVRRPSGLDEYLYKKSA